MTKPTMELVEEYGDLMQSHGTTPFREYDEEASDVLAEISQRLEADARRLEAAERDAARYRWLRGEVDGTALPLAQVVWKLNGNRESHNWTNMADGWSLDEHVDAAMAEGEG